MGVIVPTIAVFLFNRNNVHFLRDWLAYYAYLFTPRNLYIIDHSSTDSKVVALLRASGAHVTQFSGHFTEKHAALTHIMHRQSAAADFLIPVDVDEFIGSFRSGSYSFERAAVHAEFERLLPSMDGRAYKFGWVQAELCRIPARREPMRPAALAQKIGHPFCNEKRGRMISKTFYPAKDFIATDQGNHFGTVRRDQAHPIAWSVRSHSSAHQSYIRTNYVFGARIYQCIYCV